MRFARIRRAAASVARALAGGLAALAAVVYPIAEAEAILKSQARVYANLRVEERCAVTGELLRVQEKRNLVVNAGLNLIRDLLYNAAAVPITHFAVGTGSTAAAAGQTTLGTEVFRAAVSLFTPDAQKLTVKYYLSSTEANGSTLAEAGLFNAAAAGTMFARALLSSTIVKSAAITVTFTWDINLAAS